MGSCVTSRYVFSQQDSNMEESFRTCINMSTPQKTLNNLQTCLAAHDTSSGTAGVVFPSDSWAMLSINVDLLGNSVGGGYPDLDWFDASPEQF